MELVMELVEDILKAYKELGLRPVVGSWGSEEDGTASPVTALALRRAGVRPHNHHEACQALPNLHPEFIRGFTEWWDKGFLSPTRLKGLTSEEFDQCLAGAEAAVECLPALRAAGYDIPSRRYY